MTRKGTILFYFPFLATVYWAEENKTFNEVFVITVFVIASLRRTSIFDQMTTGSGWKGQKSEENIEISISDFVRLKSGTD